MADTLPAWLPALFGAAGRVAPDTAGRAAAALLTRPGGRNPPQPWELEPDPLAPRAVVLEGGLRALAWGQEGPLADSAAHIVAGLVRRGDGLGPAPAVRHAGRH